MSKGFQEECRVLNREKAPEQVRVYRERGCGSKGRGMSDRKHGGGRQQERSTGHVREGEKNTLKSIEQNKEESGQETFF